MKKILVLFFLCFSVSVSAQLEKKQIKYAKFAPAANYETLRKKGGIYSALVTDMKFYAVNRYSNDNRFEYITPSGYGGENLVDFVTVDPSRFYNRSVHLDGYDGIFLNANDITNTIVRIKSTDEEYILGCGNEIPYRRTYVINLPHAASYKKPCNCPDDTKIILPQQTDNEGLVIMNESSLNQNSGYGIPLVKKQPEYKYDFNQNLGYLTACQLMWIKKYPEAYELWLQDRNRKAFNKLNIPYGPDRRKMRRCFEGPSVLRVAGIIVGTAGITTGVYSIFNGSSGSSSGSSETWDGNPTN